MKNIRKYGHVIENIRLNGLYALVLGVGLFIIPFILKYFNGTSSTLLPLQLVFTLFIVLILITSLDPSSQHYFHYLFNGFLTFILLYYLILTFRFYNIFGYNLTALFVIVLTLTQIRSRKLLYVLTISTIVSSFLFLSIVGWNRSNIIFFLALTLITLSQHFTNLERYHTISNHFDIAYIDALTGTPNRRLFMEIIKSLLAQNKPFGLIVMDIDDFKILNDTFGYQVGDELLKGLADRIASRLKSHEHVSRISGDEYGILITGLHHREDIIERAQEIFNDIKIPFINNYKLHFSAGLGVSPFNGREFETILKSADVAMYYSKNHKNGKLSIYEDLMKSELDEIYRISNDIYGGLNDHQFIMLYQPKFGAKNEELEGFEALIRWQRTPNILWTPDQFIENAEYTDLILDLDMHVIDLVISQIQKWLDIYPMDSIKPISINISGKHFFNPKIYQTITTTLEKYKVPAHLLKVEITETALIRNMVLTSNMISRLNTYGVSVQLDDFGTGYSALKYLSIFDVDTIKIDRSFIAEIGQVEETENLIKVIIDLSKSLNLKTIAEGVETKEQLEFLRKKGVDIIQGYYYSKPEPIYVIEKHYFPQRLKK